MLRPWPRLLAGGCWCCGLGVLWGAAALLYALPRWGHDLVLVRQAARARARAGTRARAIATLNLLLPGLSLGVCGGGFWTLGSR